MDDFIIGLFVFMFLQSAVFLNPFEWHRFPLDLPRLDLANLQSIRDFAEQCEPLLAGTDGSLF